MNEQSQLNASMWLMIAIQTMGAIDLPGHGPRKLPAPKTYVAVAILWSIFGLIADAGQGKAATTMAWVTTTTAMVIGPFGKTATDFLNTIAKNFSTAPPTTNTSSQVQGGGVPQGTTLV